MSRSAEAQRNRELMPETARIVASFRRVFGADVRVVWVMEGEIERGRPSVPARSLQADQWLRYVETGEAA